MAFCGWKFGDQVHVLFEAGLARRATQDEQRAAQQLVMRAGSRPIEALQDLWWAILNSNEFIMVH